MLIELFIHISDIILKILIAVLPDWQAPAWYIDTVYKLIYYPLQFNAVLPIKAIIQVTLTYYGFKLGLFIYKTLRSGGKIDL